MINQTWQRGSQKQMAKTQSGSRHNWRWVLLRGTMQSLQTPPHPRQSQLHSVVPVLIRILRTAPLLHITLLLPHCRGSQKKKNLWRWSCEWNAVRVNSHQSIESDLFFFASVESMSFLFNCVQYRTDGRFTKVGRVAVLPTCPCGLLKPGKGRALKVKRQGGSRPAVTQHWLLHLL